MAILRAIVAGEREPVRLAQFRNAACKSSTEMIAKALMGSWKVGVAAGSPPVMAGRYRMAVEAPKAARSEP